MALENHHIYLSHFFKGKIAKNMDFENHFPPFKGFSIIDLVYHGFFISRFSVSPKIRDKQGLPVHTDFVKLMKFITGSAWF